MSEWLESGRVHGWTKACVCERETVRETERHRPDIHWTVTWNLRNSHPPLLRATPSPARPSPRGQYPAQVSQQQPSHRVAMWATEVTCVLFFGLKIKSSFSSVIRRKRRQKHAVQHCARSPLKFLLVKSILSQALLEQISEIALRTPEERLPSVAPKEEFGRMIFQKKSSLGDRTKVQVNNVGRCGLYICVCECLLQNNNHKTKRKNNTNRGSAFEPSGLPYYCTSSVCVPDVIGVLAVWIQNQTKKTRCSVRRRNVWRPV